MNVKRGIQRILILFSVLLCILWIIIVLSEKSSYTQPIIAIISLSGVSIAAIWIIYYIVLWIIKGFDEKKENE